MFNNFCHDRAWIIKSEFYNVPDEDNLLCTRVSVEAWNGTHGKAGADRPSHHLGGKYSNLMSSPQQEQRSKRTSYAVLPSHSASFSLLSVAPPFLRVPSGSGTSALLSSEESVAGDLAER